MRNGQNENMFCIEGPLGERHVHLFAYGYYQVFLHLQHNKLVHAETEINKPRQILPGVSLRVCVCV